MLSRRSFRLFVLRLFDDILLLRLSSSAIAKRTGRRIHSEMTSHLVRCFFIVMPQSTGPDPWPGCRLAPQLSGAVGAPPVVPGQVASRRTTLCGRASAMLLQEAGGTDQHLSGFLMLAPESNFSWARWRWLWGRTLAVSGAGNLVQLQTQMRCSSCRCMSGLPSSGASSWQCGLVEFLGCRSKSSRDGDCWAPSPSMVSGMLHSCFDLLQGSCVVCAWMR